MHVYEIENVPIEILFGSIVVLVLEVLEGRV